MRFDLLLVAFAVTGCGLFRAAGESPVPMEPAEGQCMVTTDTFRGPLRAVGTGDVAQTPWGWSGMLEARREGTKIRLPGEHLGAVATLDGQTLRMTRGTIASRMQTIDMTRSTFEWSYTALGREYEFASVGDCDARSRAVVGALLIFAIIRNEEQEDRLERERQEWRNRTLN